MVSTAQDGTLIDLGIAAADLSPQWAAAAAISSRDSVEAFIMELIEVAVRGVLRGPVDGPDGDVARFLMFKESPESYRRNFGGRWVHEEADDATA